MAKIKTSAPGSVTPFAGIFPDPIISNRAPTTTDKKDVEPGQLWVHQSADACYVLSKVSAGLATWVILGGGAVAVQQLTGDTGTATPTAGSIQIAGTAGEISTVGAASAITVSLPVGLTYAKGNMSIDSAQAGVDLTLSVINSSAVAASGAALVLDTSGVGLGEAFIRTLTDNFAFSFGTDEATGNFTISTGPNITADTALLIDPNGEVRIVQDDLLVTRSDAGSAVEISITNSNAAASSDALLSLTADETGPSDAQVSYNQSTSGDAWSHGMISGGSWQLCEGNALGANIAIQVDLTTRDTNINNNLILSSAGKQIQMVGGLATDFIGSAVLVGGTVTVANTNIAAGDRILVVRSTTGGTEGHLSYTINAGVSFTINSSSGTDTSTVVYVIIRQV